MNLPKIAICYGLNIYGFYDPREKWAKGTKLHFTKGCLQNTVDRNWTLAIFNIRQQNLFFLCLFHFHLTKCFYMKAEEQASFSLFRCDIFFLLLFLDFDLFMMSPKDTLWPYVWFLPKRSKVHTHKTWIHRSFQRFH